MANHGGDLRKMKYDFTTIMIVMAKMPGYQESSGLPERD